MDDITLTVADQAFYEWLHANRVACGSISAASVDTLREVFTAGYTAAMAMAGAGDK